MPISSQSPPSVRSAGHSSATAPSGSLPSPSHLYPKSKSSSSASSPQPQLKASPLLPLPLLPPLDSSGVPDEDSASPVSVPTPVGSVVGFVVGVLLVALSSSSSGLTMQALVTSRQAREANESFFMSGDLP